MDSWATQHSSTRSLEYYRWAAHLAVLDGDLDLAARIASEWESATADSSRLDDHVFPNRFRQWLALERGDNDEAGRIARDFLVRSRAWPAPPYDFDPRIYSIATMRISGASSAAVARAEAASWLATELGRPGAERGNAWVWAYAGITRDRADAEYALEALPRYMPLSDPLTRRSNYDELIGSVFLKDGMPLDALPYLRRAAHACRAVDFPFAQLHAGLALAQALRATGKIRESCEESRNLAAWARRAGKSVTARAVLREVDLCNREQ